MLYRDRKQLLLWMALGFAAAALLYDAGMGSRFSQLVYCFLFQIFAMQPVRTLVQFDRACGWKQAVQVLPLGRRWYALEKYIVLLLMVPALLAGAYVGGQIYAYRLYGEWIRFLMLPRESFLWVYFWLISALQMPVLLLADRRIAQTAEMLTWLVSFPVLVWLDNGRIAAYQNALRQGRPPAAMDTLEYHRWYDVDWTGLGKWAAVLFLVSAAVTVWLAGRVREHGRQVEEKGSLFRQFFWENSKRAVLFCSITAVLLAALLYLDAHTPQRDIYIYEKPHWKGGVSYLVTSSSPEEVAERFPAEDYTHIGTYMAYNAFAKVAGGIDGTFLIWDNDWFLWELETGEKTPVSLPADERIADVQLLGSAVPEIIGVFRRDVPGEPGGAAGFFSIKQNRMITGWDFEYWHDNLIDGQIAARIGQYEEEKWVLVDSVTGEITGTLPGRPKQ